MAEITKYVLVDANGNEDDAEYDRFEDAKRAALTTGEPTAVIERVYEYTDSSLVWASDGSRVWPPDADDRIGDEDDESGDAPDSWD